MATLIPEKRGEYVMDGTAPRQARGVEYGKLYGAKVEDICIVEPEPDNMGKGEV